MAATSSTTSLNLLNNSTSYTYTHAAPCYVPENSQNHPGILSTVSKPKADVERLVERIHNCFQIASVIEELTLFNREKTEVLLQRMAFGSVQYFISIQNTVYPLLKELNELKKKIGNRSCFDCLATPVSIVEDEIRDLKIKLTLTRDKLYQQSKNIYSQAILLQIRMCTTYRITSDSLKTITDSQFPAKLIAFEQTLKDISEKFIQLNKLDQKVKKLDQLVNFDSNDYKLEDHFKLIKAKRKRLIILSKLKSLILLRELNYFHKQLSSLKIEKIVKPTSKELISNDSTVAVTSIKMMNVAQNLCSNYSTIKRSARKIFDFCEDLASTIHWCLETRVIQEIISVYYNLQFENRLPSRDHNNRLYCIHLAMRKIIYENLVDNRRNSWISNSSVLKDEKEFLAIQASIHQMIFKTEMVQSEVEMGPRPFLHYNRIVRKEMIFQDVVGPSAFEKPELFVCVISTRNGTDEELFAIVDRINRSYIMLTIRANNEGGSFVFKNSKGRNITSTDETALPGVLIDFVQFIAEMDHYNTIKAYFNDLNIPEWPMRMIIEYVLGDTIIKDMSKDDIHLQKTLISEYTQG